MTFEPITPEKFDRQFKKLSKRNSAFAEQVIKKIPGICEHPELGEPKSENLKGLRSVHITKHFVVVYLLFKNFIVFINMGHHDVAYNADKITQLIKRLPEDKNLLIALEKAGIAPEEFIEFMKTIGK